MIKSLITIIALLVCIPGVHAEVQPKGGAYDSRIKTVRYTPNDVIRIKGFYGFITTLFFEDGEKIVNVAIGDDAAWQITKNNAHTKLYFKPLLEDADTNMTIITNRRDYHFYMIAENAYDAVPEEMTFALRFTYANKPEKYARQKQKKIDNASRNNTAFGSVANIFGRSAVQQKGSQRFLLNNSNNQPVIEEKNYAYTWAGSNVALPITVFDDGRFTYFAFADHRSLPAIFEIMEDGREKLLNFTPDDGLLVVHKVVNQFALRHSGKVTCVFNENILPPNTPDNRTRRNLATNEKVGGIKPFKYKPERQTGDR